MVKFSSLFKYHMIMQTNKLHKEIKLGINQQGRHIVSVYKMFNLLLKTLIFINRLFHFFIKRQKITKITNNA